MGVDDVCNVGNTGVVLGRRRADTGIPDIDGSGRGQRLPRAPGNEDRSGAPPKQPLDIPAELARVSLARCECKLPVAGLLYFPYRGKLKAIKSMVLQYTAAGDGSTVSLEINP